MAKINPAYRNIKLSDITLADVNASNILNYLKRCIKKDGIPEINIPLDVLVKCAKTPDKGKKLIHEYQPSLIEPQQISMMGASFDIGSILEPQDDYLNNSDIAAKWDIDKVYAKSLRAKVKSTGVETTSHGIRTSELLNYLNPHSEYMFLDAVVNTALKTFTDHNKGAPYDKDDVDNRIRNIGKNQKPVNIGMPDHPVYIVKDDKYTASFLRTIQLQVYDAKQKKIKLPKSIDELFKISS